VLDEETHQPTETHKPTRERNFYVHVLASEECQCGAEKRRRFAFCYRCFNSLPRLMQIDLRQRLGGGFEEAYDKAAAWLR